jgi:hypothetical protein
MAQKLKFGNGTWATKEGSTLAYNDENNNYKPLPFTTTRNSIATRVNKEGLIEVVGNDIPRIDYTDSADGVLLLENSATNLITQSQAFDNSYWTKTGSSVTSGFISPDGTNNSFKLVENSSSGTHLITKSQQSHNNSYSVFAKKGEKKWILLTSHSTSAPTARGQFFDLENGIVGEGGDANGKIEDYGNGWYRCSIEPNSPSSLFTVMLADGDGVFSYQGNGADGVYIWGAQNTDTDLSSYIPTSGSTVTRQADTASGAGNSEVFNDSEGVLFVNIKTFFNDLLSRPISVSDGTTSNRINLFYPSNQTQVYGRITSGGTRTADMIFSGIIQTLYNKIAVKYKVNDFALWVNGFKVVTDSSGAVPTGLKELNFDNSGGTKFLGKTKELGYYDEILTDLELETLTSYRSLNELVTELNLNEL